MFLAVAEVDPTPIVVSIVSLAGVIYAASQAKGAKNAAQGVRDEIQTNHGKRAGDYLEYIGELANGQEVLAGRIDAVARSQGEMIDRLGRHESKLSSLCDRIKHHGDCAHN